MYAPRGSSTLIHLERSRMTSPVDPLRRSLQHPPFAPFAEDLESFAVADQANSFSTDGRSVLIHKMRKSSDNPSTDSDAIAELLPRVCRVDNRLRSRMTIR